LPVPRAHVLAGIAAEDAVAEPGGELFGDRAPVLDGPVADAPVRVEAAGRDEGVGGAGVEAGGAAAAKIARCFGLFGDGNVEEESRDEESRAVLPVEQGGVLAAPAEARLGSEVALEHGPGVAESGETKFPPRLPGGGDFFF